MLLPVLKGYTDKNNSFIFDKEAVGSESQVWFFWKSSWKADSGIQVGSLGQSKEKLRTL